MTLEEITLKSVPRADGMSSTKIPDYDFISSNPLKSTNSLPTSNFAQSWYFFGDALSSK